MCADYATIILIVPAEKVNRTGRNGCEVDADKGYQGMADQVHLVTVCNPETGLKQQVPRLTVYTPFKKVKGKELTEQQEEFNSQLSAVRVRVEHCIGWVKNWAVVATLLIVHKL